mmetsp:Transcript_12658/g.36826  ORF Transcript_12658/g.36826 Transcript_12658/m.36826 type:complete len:384 (+) Transcript_12658:265-1416(+)
MHAFVVDLQAFHATLGEGIARISNQACRLKEIGNHERLEDVQFELALRASDGDGNMISHHLSADHRDGLALRRIDLAGHDGGTRFVGWQRQFAQATSRSASQQTKVVRHLVQAACDGVENSRNFDQRIVRCQCLELVGRRDKWKSCGLGQPFRDGSIVPLRGVQSGSDGSAAQCEPVDGWETRLDSVHAVLDLLCVPANFLPNGQRRGVLTMRAPDLDDGFVLGRLFLQRLQERFHAWHRHLDNHLGQADVHGSWEGIVARLSHVEVIIRVHRRLAADDAIEDLDGSVGQHLVHVHVGLRARSCLERHQRELAIVLPTHDLVGRLRDGIRHLLLHLADFGMVEGAAFLHLRHGVHDLQRHFGFRSADWEVLQRTLRLASPQAT